MFIIDYNGLAQMRYIRKNYAQLRDSFWEKMPKCVVTN